MTDQSTAPIPHIMTLAQVCELTQLSDSTLRRAIRSGLLRASKPTGKDLRITSQAVEAWLASTSTSPTA